MSVATGAKLEFTTFGKIPRLRRPVTITEKIDGCLPHGAKISMADGSRKRIIELQVGDEVLGYDGTVVPTLVRNTFVDTRPERWVKITATRANAGRGCSYAALHATPNHQFATQGGYTMAKDLRVGETLSLLRSELGLTPVQRSVLLGKLLGDGSLDVATSGSASVGFGHRTEDGDYVDWTLRAMGDLANPAIAMATSGYGSEMQRGRSVFAPTLSAEFEDFKSPNGKCVPDWVADALDPVALAFWYMDDGSLAHCDGQEDRAHIASDGFSARDHDVLTRALGRLGIGVHIQESRGRLSISLRADDAERLFLLVAPYIPPCMQRKLPERYRGGTGWLPPPENGYKTQVVEQTITDIVDDARHPSRRYDIETGTHNFFANGMLVHNSNAAVVVEEQMNKYEDLHSRGDAEEYGPGIVVNIDQADGWRPVLVYAQSRKRVISPDSDNFGFARWVRDHADELAVGLGPGIHYGEWWGQGIQRGYGLTEKRFSLFNTTRWTDDVRPACCHIVPVLLAGQDFSTQTAMEILADLQGKGSRAAPGYDKPEGIIIYHVAGNVLFKATIEDDKKGKGREVAPALRDTRV